MSFLEDVLVDRVLEVWAECESEAVEGLGLVVPEEIEDREVLHLLEVEALCDPHVDDRIHVVEVCLHEGFLAETVLLHLGFSKLGLT